MSQHQAQPFTPRPSILRSQCPGVVLTPPTEDISKYASYEAEFIDIIPASNRQVWCLTYNKGEFIHFRPTPNASMDPFAHSIFARRTEGEKCWIKDCEYCALCAEYSIDPHALQMSLIPEGCGSSKWDPYFHWMMNDQIPRLHTNGSINTGKCWIKDCQYPYCNPRYQSSTTTANTELLGCPCKELKYQAQKNRRKFFFACGCGAKRKVGGNEDVYYTRQTGRYPGWPVEVCPHWSRRSWLLFSSNNCCAKCTVMARLVTKEFEKPTRLTPPKKQHNDIIYRRIAFALSPLAVDPEAQPREEWENYEHVFFNLPREAIQAFKHVTFADAGEPPRESRSKKWTRARAPSPHPTARLALKRHRQQDSSSDGYEADAESMSREPAKKCSKRRKSVLPRRIIRRRSQSPRTARLNLVRINYRGRSGQHQLFERQTQKSGELTTGTNTSFGNSLEPQGFILSTPAGSALAALKSIRHTASAGSTTFTTQPMGVISPLAPSTMTQANTPVGEARSGSNEDAQERFAQWLNQIGDEWNRPRPRTVKLEPISFWRRIKILSGWEKDPNVCRFCGWCKTACTCQIQQQDGRWVMYRDLDEAAR